MNRSDGRPADPREPRPEVAVLIRALTVGGAERALLRVAAWLADAGHEVEIVQVTGDRDPELVVPEGLRIRNLGAARLRGALPELVRYLGSRRPESVLVTGPHLAVAVAVAHLLSRSGARLAIRATNRLAEPSPSGRLVGSLRMQVARAALARADVVIAPSKSLGDELRPIMGDTSRLRVVDNPLPAPRPEGAPEIHAWFDAPTPVVVGCGRLSPQKDWGTLLHALALCRGRVDMRALIVGDGPERARLEALSSALGLDPIVEFVGLVPEPRDLLARAAVVTLTSLWEGQPNVLIEALDAGARLVVTDAPGGSREVLEHAGGGSLVAPADVVGLAAALEQALDARPVVYDLSRHRLATVGAAYASALELRERSTAPVAHPIGGRGRARPESADEACGSGPPAALGSRAVGGGHHRSLWPGVPAPSVVHLITSAGLGGAERVLARLLAPLSEHGPQRVIVLGDRDDLIEEFRSAGAETKYLAVRSLHDVPRAVRAVRRALLAAGAAAVLQTWLYHADIIGGLATGAGSSGPPVVWNLRNVVLRRDEMSKSLRAAYPVARRLSRYVPDRIVACSDEVRRTHVDDGYPIDAFRVVANPIVRPDVDAVEVASFRFSLGIAAGVPLVGRIARSHPAKDYPMFFSAFAHLRRSHPSARALVCGDGTNSPQMRAEARRFGVEDAVHFLGARNDVPRIMAACDVTCSTSRGMEGFPNVVAESIGAGTPVVTSGIGAARQIVGAAGEVVDSHLSTSYAQALDRCLQRQDLPDRVRERARFLEDRYAVETIAEAYANVYREVLSVRQVASMGHEVRKGQGSATTVRPSA